MPAKYPIEVTPSDGNAFAILGATATALKRYGVSQSEIDEYRKEATSGDYDHLLQVTMQWVELEP